jgi:hypothetical protein
MQMEVARGGLRMAQQPFLVLGTNKILKFIKKGLAFVSPFL